MSENKEIIAVKTLNNHSIDEILRNENNILPSTDIYENADEFILVANMPGVARSEVQVKVIDESLIVFGKINYNEIVSRDYILNENEIGNYFRKFKISDSIDKTKINAKYDNGQLLVNLPKSAKVKPRTIEIS
jgi:HSP20 family molecular chaperone IbpA